MKEFYRVEQKSKYCKGVITTKDFETFEEANEEYNRQIRLGYTPELSKITILK